MKIKYIFMFTLLIYFFSSCNSIVDKDLNVDPNNPTEASPDLILTGLEVSLMGVNSGELDRFSGLWSGYFKGTDRQYFSFYNYFILNSDFDLPWARLYEVIRNSVTLENLLNELNQEGVIAGINKTLKAQAVGTATSLWGDIPFSEAGKFDEFRTPKYDSQKDIYNNIQILLDEAISELKKHEGRPVKNADIFFDGDPDSWIKVAYTLKARFYLHTKEYSKAYQNALLGIDSPEGSLRSVQYGESDSENLYYQFYLGNRGAELWTNETFLFDIISPTGAHYRGNVKTSENARFSYLLEKLGTEQYGLNISDDGGFSKASTFPIVTFEENMLILAETGVLTIDFNTGLKYLNKLREYYNSGGGISDKYLSEESYKYEKYLPEDFEPGHLMSIEGLNQSQSLLREILTEKYISMLPQIETFNDLRRNIDSPYALPVKSNVQGEDFPQRFLYPQSEIDRNPNVPSIDLSIFDKTPINQ